MSYPVGTKIRMTRDFDNAQKGMVGTIVIPQKQKGDWYGVEFEKAFPGGHDLEGFLKRPKTRRGHFVYAEFIEVDTQDFD